MRNTFANHIKHLPSSCVQDIHYKEADEDEGGNWHHVIANSTRKTSGEKEVVDEDLRAILEDLVLVTDFLPELVNSEIISRNCYFGHYGKVKKTVFSQNSVTKKKSHLAFITYQNKLDAALAIAAMQKFTHLHYKCTTTFGTSKFCPKLLKNEKCGYEDNCYYIHSFDIKYMSVGQLKKLSHEKKIKPAIDRIRNNLKYFIKKEYQQYLYGKSKKKYNGIVMCQCQNQNKGELITLPTIKETLADLVKEGQIDSQEYYRVKKEYKKQIRLKLIQKSSKKGSQQSWLGNKYQSDTQTIKRETFNQKDCHQIASHFSSSSKKSSQSSIFQTTQQFQEEDDYERLNKDCKKEKYEESQMPYLFRKYLNPQLQQEQDNISLEKRYRQRQIKRINKGSKTTLSMYQKWMNSEKALSSYIHHKIIQEASLKYPQSSLSSSSCQNLPIVQCSAFRRIVHRHLVDNNR